MDDFDEYLNEAMKDPKFAAAFRAAERRRARAKLWRELFEQNWPLVAMYGVGLLQGWATWGITR